MILIKRKVTGVLRRYCIEEGTRHEALNVTDCSRLLQIAPDCSRLAASVYDVGNSIRQGVPCHPLVDGPDLPAQIPFLGVTRARDPKVSKERLVVTRAAVGCRGS